VITPNIPIWLVVLTCFNHLEKYEPVGMIIPYISIYYGKKTMFETTNMPMVYHHTFPGPEPAMLMSLKRARPGCTSETKKIENGGEISQDVSRYIHLYPQK